MTATEKTRRWRQKFPERNAAMRAAYRVKNSAELARKQKEYRTAKPEEVRAAISAWTKANPDKHNAGNARRRAAKRKAIVAWGDPKKIAAIYALAQQTGRTVDHIVPLKGRRVSGLHWEGNLQLLSKSENSAKGNRYECD